MTIKNALAEKVWAVIGATHKTDKFGYKIYKCLKEHGYEVYPVNPNVTSIDGDTCYPSLSALPVVPSVVDFVVPEAAGLAAVDECKQLGIKTIWLQPGADKPAVLAKAKEVGLDYIQDCVLVQLQDLLNQGGVTVIDFWAPWCGYCVRMMPVFEEIAGELEGKANFVKVNTDEEPSLARELQVEVLPTFVILKDGEVVDRKIGFLPKGDLQGAIESKF